MGVPLYCEGAEGDLWSLNHALATMLCVVKFFRVDSGHSILFE